ncbi:UNVERIFIED_CONTAM: hypothetical protein FKN15_035218 [Acipenser sinensis]
MQKGWKKYFGQKPLSEVNMDEYLASLGLYRKITARDASCLFRAVSEQFVEGSFEKYLERLEDPKETAGQVEIKALSLMYKRRFIIYRHPGKPPTEVADEDYKEKVVLCCSNNGHYDNVYPKHYPADAAVCQAVLYEVLYKDVFGIEEEEVHSALDVFHGSGGRRYRNSSSMCSEDANFKTSDEKNHKSPTANKKSAFELTHFESVLYEVLYRDVFGIEEEEIHSALDVFHGSGGRRYRNSSSMCSEDANFETSDEKNHKSPTTKKKHLVPLTNLKPVTQVNPVPAWNSAPNRKGGNYNRMSDGYAAELDHDVRGRRRFYKKARGKEMFMAVAYSRGQSGLPPRLQHNIPSGRSSPIHNPPGSTNMTPYEQYRPHPSSQRAGRGYGPPRVFIPFFYRSSARFVNRHHLVGPEVAYYSSPGRRYYQSFDNYSYRSRIGLKGVPQPLDVKGPCSWRSYSRSRQQMPCVNKECQFTFVPDNGEESQGLDGTITFYELEEGDETAFPPLPEQGVSPPLAPPPATFWLRREPSPSGMQAMASSEEDMDERSNSATVFTSGSTASSQSPAAPHQSTVQPVIVSPHPVTRPVVLPPVSVLYPPGAPLFVNELGEPVSDPPPPPPYSCDPNGYDLPRDYRVVQYYFNMGVQVSITLFVLISANMAYSVTDCSAPNVEAAPVSQGAVYYPVMTGHFNQQPLPTYEPCIPMVPAYHYVAPWPPVNQPRIHGTLCPTTVHQVNYVGSPTPPAYYIPQNM